MRSDLIIEKERACFWNPIAYITPLVTVSIGAFVLARTAWNNRSVPGGYQFSLFLGAIASWSLVYALELGSAELSTKLFWYRAKYLFIVAVPLTALAFSLQFTLRERWLTWRNYLASTLIPFASLALLWSNEYHGLFLASVQMATEPIPTLAVEYGPAILASYNLLLSSLFCQHSVDDPCIFLAFETTIAQTDRCHCHRWQRAMDWQRAYTIWS